MCEFITRTYLTQVHRLAKQVQCPSRRLSSGEGLELCGNSGAWLKLPHGRGQLAFLYPFLSFLRKSKLRDPQLTESGPWGTVLMT